MPVRKRSQTIRLTTMLAGAALIGCEQNPGGSASWGESEKVEAQRYATVADCKLADVIPDAECDTAWSAAQAGDQTAAPAFADKAQCEQQFGSESCVNRGGFFSPLLAGFVIGRMMNAGGQPYYRGAGVYGGAGGGFVTGNGARVQSDYATGRSYIARDGVEPGRPGAVRTRGGFGRSYGGGFGG